MRDQIGFGRDQVAAGVDPDAIAVDFSVEQVENVANFQAYGFLPELVARFTRVVPFCALDAATLKDICAPMSCCGCRASSSSRASTW